jgi:hypothetical protein
VAYLHIKVSDDGNGLANNTSISVWYDHDGNPDTSLLLVASDTIAGLDCHEFLLGELPAEAVRQLMMEIEYIGSCPSRGLSFDIIFALASKHGVEASRGFKAYGFADSEMSQNSFSAPG